MAQEPTKKAPGKTGKHAKRVAKHARKKAADQGRDWKGLSQDERKAMKQEVRQDFKAKRTAKEK
jgi:hypothetical protein